MTKVATDGKTTTFAHDDGHLITILHSALPRIHQEQIKRLPLKEDPEMMADGGEVDDTKPQMKAEPIDPSSPDAQPAAPTSPTGPVVINVNPAGSGPAYPSGPPTTAPVPQAAQGPNSAPTPSAAPAPAPSQPSTPSTPAPALEEAPQDFNAVAVKANEEAMASQAKANQETQDSVGKLHRVLNEFNQYQQKNPINPNHWAESLDSKQKGDVAIGLALMGFGGNANLGFDFINKQIDRDIAAQQRNVDNRATVFGGYKEMFGDDAIAANMTRATANDIYAHRVNVAALSQGTNQAKQQAQAFTAAKQQENEQLMQQTAPLLNAKKKEAAAVPDQLFAPGYKKAMFALKFNDIAKTDYPKVVEEVTQAEQAQKAMDEVNKVFPQLTNNATFQGRIARGGSGAASVAGGAIGTLIGGKLGGARGAAEGAGIGAGLGHSMASAGNLGNEANKQYEAQKEQLVKTIGNLLPQFGPTAVNEAADKFAPEQGDSPETIEVKRKGFIDLIRNSVKHTVADQYPGIMAK